MKRLGSLVTTATATHSTPASSARPPLRSSDQQSRQAFSASPTAPSIHEQPSNIISVDPKLRQSHEYTPFPPLPASFRSHSETTSDPTAEAESDPTVEAAIVPTAEADMHDQTVSSAQPILRSDQAAESLPGSAPPSQTALTTAAVTQTAPVPQSLDAYSMSEVPWLHTLDQRIAQQGRPDLAYSETRNLESIDHVFSDSGYGTAKGAEQSIPAQLSLAMRTASNSIPASRKDAAEEVDADMNDGSVYSDDGLQPALRKQLVLRFSEALNHELTDVGFRQLNTGLTAGLLKDFARLLDSRANTSIEHRSTKFVRNQSKVIACHLDQDPQAGRPSHADVPSVQEKFSSWNTDLDGTGDETQETPHDLMNMKDAGMTEEVVIDIAELPEAESFLTSSQEFNWLVRRLKAAYGMLPTSNIPTLLRNQLVEATKGAEQLSFRLDWQPLQFLSEQYVQVFKASLSKTLVLVGSDTKAYATLCGAYVERIWPTIGTEVLRLLEEACTLHASGISQAYQGRL